MKRLNEKKWREATDPANALLLKAVDSEVVAVDAEERTLQFRISTETPDSYNDVVKADGWVLDRFLKNPVVLWAHDHRQPPVAQAVEVGIEDSNLVAKAKFADADTYGFADTVFRLLKKGFLRATSVGFMPLEWTFDEERGGFNFLKQELFEFSVVPVPANPDALALALDSGIDCTPLKEWAEKTLDLWKPDDDYFALWLPKSQLESIHKQLNGDTVIETSPGIEAVLTTSTTRDSQTDAATTWYPATTTGPPLNTTTIPDANTTAAEGQPAEVIETTSEGDAILRDMIEDLMAQLDQLNARLHELESADDRVEEAEAVEAVEAVEKEEADDADDLSAVIDLQIDSSEIEDEIDRALVDLEIDPAGLHGMIRKSLEAELMKITGKLPKEV